MLSFIMSPRSAALASLLNSIAPYLPVPLLHPLLSFIEAINPSQLDPSLVPFLRCLATTHPAVTTAVIAAFWRACFNAEAPCAQQAMAALVEVLCASGAHEGAADMARLRSGVVHSCITNLKNSRDVSITLQLLHLLISALPRSELHVGCASRSLPLRVSERQAHSFRRTCA